MVEQQTGQSIAYWRKRRGLTQRTLAGLAGISQPYPAQIERGHRTVDRRSTLAALAGALSVSLPELTGQHGDPTDPAQAKAHAAVPAIREALIMREAGETTPSNGSTVEDLMNAGQGYDFASAAPMLSRLITGTTGVDLIQACHVGTFMLRYLGYADLSRDAARLALHTARGLEDPAWIGVAEVLRIFSVPTEVPELSLRLARRAADEVQPAAGDKRARQAYGMLHLHASLRSAVACRTDDALSHLREAQEAAGSLGDPGPDLGLARLAFGPTNLGIWRMTVYIELGETARAIESASAVHAEAIPLATRQAPFHLDLAHALATRGRDDEAIAELLRAEAIAPQWVRVRPVARDLVTTIVRRTRRNAVGRPLRRAAAITGIRIPD